MFVAGKRYAADEYASSKKEAERLAASKALEQILASKQTASTPGTHLYAYHELSNL